MTVKSAPKAETYGQEGEWQIHPSVRRKIYETARERSDEYFSEEAVDDLIAILANEGYLIVSG